MDRYQVGSSELRPVSYSALSPRMLRALELKATIFPLVSCTTMPSTSEASTDS